MKFPPDRIEERKWDERNEFKCSLALCACDMWRGERHRAGGQLEHVTTVHEVVFLARCQWREGISGRSIRCQVKPLKEFFNVVQVMERPRVLEAGFVDRGK